MNILQKRNYTFIGALAIGCAGLLATSMAVAGPEGGGYGGDKYEDDDGYGGDKYEDDDGYGGKGKGKKQEPRFEDEGESLKAEALIRGLKRDRDVRVELEASAKVEIECRGKGKGKGWGKGWGKGKTKQVWLDLSDVQHIKKHKIEDNRLYIEIETEDAEDELEHDWDDYGCDRRDRNIKQVRFYDARLRVKQGKHEVVEWLCTFDPPTRDGDVARKDVECHTLY